MSKQIADRQRSNRAVVDAITEHGAAIAAAQQRMLEGSVGRLGVPPVDVRALLGLYADTLRYDMGQLTAAGAVHAQESLDDSEPRERRDRAERTLRDHLGPLRKTVEGVFGDSGLKSLGFWEPLPSTVEVLLNYGQTVVDSLKRPALSLTPLLATPATQFDAAGHGAALAPVVKVLADALGDVSREEAELSTTLIARNQAMAVSDRSFMNIAGIVERMARAAGLTEVADRIRPSSSRPGVLIDVPSEEELAAPVTPTKPVSPNFPGADPFDPEEDAAT
jgi:hypothetical protein